MKTIFLCLSAVISFTFYITNVGSAPLNEAYTSFRVENKKLELIGNKMEFKFTEGIYPAGTQIKYIRKKQANYSSPEYAAVSRFSAIASQDLEWWKQQWVSEEEAIESLSKLVGGSNGTQASILERWANITKYKNIFLIRKISYKDYAIITYKVVDKADSYNSKAIELPIVFKKVGSVWKVSSGLSKSALLAFSPWKTGKYVVIEDAYWTLED